MSHHNLNKVHSSSKALLSAAHKSTSNSCKQEADMVAYDNTVPSQGMCLANDNICAARSR